MVSIEQGLVVMIKRRVCTSDAEPENRPGCRGDLYLDIDCVNKLPSTMFGKLGETEHVLEEDSPTKDTVCRGGNQPLHRKLTRWYGTTRWTQLHK